MPIPYQSYYPQIKLDMDRAVRGWVGRVCVNLVREAKKHCPKGATGLLRASIKYFLLYPKVSMVVAGRPYARYVEGYPKPTRRHFVAFKGKPHFKRWGRQRGFDTSRGGLQVWGYNIPFMRTAVNLTKPKARRWARQLRLKGSV